jgi:RNA polymerase sigma-70 factor, ECF subfamily
MMVTAKTAPAVRSEQEFLRLLDEITQGNQNALNSLYEQTNRVVFILILRITNNRSAAEEVTLDVFFEIWRKSSTYDPVRGSVIGWILGRARSRAIDRVRLESRKKRIHFDAAVFPYSTLENRNGCDCTLSTERELILRKAVETLTPGEREVIEIAFFKGMTYQEVSVLLDQPLGTVKTRIRSGLCKLRRILGPQLENI